jgi:tetratricopeptide (TPR) repeat protein
MLTYLVNSLFKNDKLKLSLKYTNVLHKAMEEFGKMLYDKYLFFYYNSLVINYSQLDKQKAIHVLDELRENKKITATPFYEIFVYLNLGVLHFDIQKYRESIRFISQLYQLNSYKNADRSLQFKIAVMELMVRYELSDFEYLDYRIGRIRKDFKDLIRNQEFLKEKEFLLIISKLQIADQSRATMKKMKQYVEKYKDYSDGDDEIINYTHWLNSKIKRKR